MKKRIIITAMITSMLVYFLSSCYRNKEDILAVPKVSFRSDVVPIVTAGACGCHNNGIGTRAVQFSHYDTIFYDAILARAFVLDTMARFDKHPGGGVIYFTDFQKVLLQNGSRKAPRMMVVVVRLPVLLNILRISCLFIIRPARDLPVMAGLPLHLITIKW